MQRLIASLLLAALYSSLCSAETELPELKLNCSLSSSNYPLYKDSFEFQSITLKGLKHQPGGAGLVFDWSNHEFWAMNHKIQTVDQSSTVINFQLAVRNKASGEFIHALSNDVGSDTFTARLSLVSYAPDELFELGEILFQCNA